MQAATSFGRQVKQYRSALGLTQEALAERVACAVQTIRKIEADERRPSPVMAERLADALELPGDERPAFLRAARAGVSQALPDPGLAPAASPTPGPPPLPAYSTRFVGREEELAKLARLLSDPSYRLVTLVGPGGMGKTRLAVEAARRQAARGQVAAFVPLAPLSSTALLASAIADAIGFRFSGAEPPTQQLLLYLQDKDLLLILDNMEHLLDAVALVAALIEQAPRVTLLVTSRERLNLQGEWIVDLPGLPTWLEELPGEHVDADAVVLFAERARQVQHDFHLGSENRNAIRRICRLLQGMPLGIELAATWVRVLSCVSIAEGIERSLDFLEASTRDRPERHRSVRAVFQHSWQLLGRAEQQALRRLTVFRGGFDRVAAEQVTGTTLLVLAALVDKSLVRREGTERYDLHEMVRQYAAMHLELDPQEHTAVQDRHCAYFTAFLAAREQPLKSVLQLTAAAELVVEIDNVRSAWHRAAQRRRTVDMLRAMPALFVFYELRGAYEEAAHMFQQAAELLEGSTTTPQAAGALADENERILLGELLAYQAWFTSRHGRFEQARELLQRSLTLLGSQSTEAALSEALPYLWMLWPDRGDYGEGERLLRRCLELRRVHGDQRGVAFTLLHLGLLAGFKGDTAEAYHLMREALVSANKSGEPMAITRILGFASSAAYEIGAYEEAQRLAQECIAMSSETGERFALGLAFSALGLVAHAQGKYLEARTRLEQSLAFYKELGDRWSMARVLSHLGHTYLALGASAEAYQTFLMAIELAMEANTLPRELDAVLALATLLWDQGRIEQATELCLHVLRQPGGSQETNDQAARLRAELESTLPAQQLAAIEERVGIRPLEAAMAAFLEAEQGRSTRLRERSS